MKNSLNEPNSSWSEALYCKVETMEHKPELGGVPAERRLAGNSLAALCRDAATEELGR